MCIEAFGDGGLKSLFEWNFWILYLFPCEILALSFEWVEEFNEALKMWTWSVLFVLCIAEAIWRLKIHDNQEGGGVAQTSPYPDRPGEPDCLFYLRTGLCGYGSNCRFNHPAYAAQVIQIFLWQVIVLCRCEFILGE